jgi:RND family efflux transporter MFP subunit
LEVKLNPPDGLLSNYREALNMTSEPSISPTEDFRGESDLASDRLRRTGRRTQMAAGAVSALLLVGFIGAYGVRMQDSDRLAAATESDVAAAPPVDVATVKPPAATSLLTLPGETAAWYATTIYARVDGYVGKWFVDIGDHVQEGQVLATIETPELDAELDAARAKLNAAMADVQVREAEARFADSTYQRWKNSPKGVVSEQETEDKKAGFEGAQAKLSAAHAQVNLAQGEVDRLKAFQKFKQVTAPFKGTITQRRIDIGNLVTAGSSASTTPLYRLVQDDPIRVFVAVPQNAAPSMKTGTAVDVVTTGAESRSFPGTITRTSDAVDSQARTLQVEIDLPNPDETLVPGLYIEANFHLANTGVSEIPAAALIFRTEGPQVAVVEGDRVAFRKVAIAEDNGTTVSLSSGVTNGDKVVLNISSEISDGEKVHVTGADSAGTQAQR